MFNKRQLLGLIILPLLGMVASIVVYPSLPTPSAIHWNLHGQADGFSSPMFVAVVGPVVTLGLIVLLAVLPLLGPMRENLLKIAKVYRRITVVLATLLLGIHVIVLLKAAGDPLAIGAWMSILIGSMFVLLGNWMGKLRRNFYVGIRTPWTLANEQVWDKTHRHGGRLMMSIGFASVLCGLTAPQVVCFAVLIGGAFVLFVWSLVYSLVLYRRLGQKDDLSIGGGKVTTR